MELYTLDQQFRRQDVVDSFESLIWTERFSAFGDFSMQIAVTQENERRLTPGTYVTHNKTLRAMEIETVDKTVSDEGRVMLTVSGRSMESFLEQRLARRYTTNTTTNGKWKLTGTPAWILREMFRIICVTGALSATDILPYYTTGNLYPNSTISEPADEVTIEFEIASLYAEMKKLADVYNLGFRIYPGRDYPRTAVPAVYFGVYSGTDRTTQQTTVAPVIFSRNLDNLTNTSELVSIGKYKNVCYVFHKNGTRVVYAAGASASTSGFARRAMTIEVTDVDLPAGPALDLVLLQRGNEALSAQRSVFAFDGEVPQFSNYVYGTHYNLGDLVEQRNDAGSSTNMRVTEQIFVHDREGERSYPTLSVDLVIMSGTWRAWDSNQIWPNAPGNWGTS